MNPYIVPVTSLNAGCIEDLPTYRIPNQRGKGHRNRMGFHSRRGNKVHAGPVNGRSMLVLSDPVRAKQVRCPWRPIIHAVDITCYEFWRALADSLPAEQIIGAT
jgi:hypothetical protein